MGNKKRSNGLTRPVKNKIYKNPGITAAEKTVSLYLAIVLSVFWVYSTNALFNLKNDKYTFFCNVTFAAFAVFAVCLIGTLIYALQKPIVPSDRKIKKLCTADVGMLLFFISAALSTYFSAYRQEAITGELGRRNGLILIFAYLLCYIMVSYFYKGSMSLVYLFLTVGLFVCGLGIVNNFGFDPLDYISRISESQRAVFISTIGNINFFATFVCVFFSVSFGMLMISEHIAGKVFSIICLAVGSGALIAANSDLGFFAVFVFMGIMSIYSFKSIKRLHMYAIAWLTLTLSMKLMPVLCKISGGHHVLVEKISDFLMNSTVMYYIIAFFLAATVVITVLRKNDKLLEVPSRLYIAAIVLVVLCVLGGAGVLIYFSCINTTADLGGLSNYLRINEKWGTNRGYIWIRSIQSFLQFDWVHKLFGSGPDTLRVILDSYYGEEIAANYNVYFDSAHNEYIEWLVTLGICGLVGILTFIIGAVVRMIRCSKNKPQLVVFYGAVIIYSLQAIFNIGQPLTTTMLFLFLAMGISVSRTSSNGSIRL